MAIPPVTLNLFELFASDSQTTHIDKINFNFEQIVSLGGGPPGEIGLQGVQGVPGSQGIQGFEGPAGDPGTRWYVQSTTPSPSPAPNVGDFWFNIGTLEVFEWDGATWVLSSTLTVASVFKEATSDTDRIIFTNPTALKSLVLSPIDYGVGAPTSGSYKLKLIGSSGNSMMNFGVVESGNIESPAITQAYISMGTVVPNTTYSFDLINPTGYLALSTAGTNFKLKPVASGISVWEFNGDSVQVRANSTDKAIAFATAAGSDLLMHLGAQGALATGADRAISIVDDSVAGYRISLRDAYSSPMAGDDSTEKPIYLDSLHPQLLDDGSLYLHNQIFWRFRNNVGAGKVGWVSTGSRRTFDDPGNGTDPERSTAMDILAGIDGTTWGHLSFHGGATDSTETTRQMVRLGIGSQDGSVMVDVNGYVGLGDGSIMSGYNSSLDITQQFKTSVNIFPTSSAPSSGDSAFGGLHFVVPNVGGARVGITSGDTGGFMKTANGIYLISNGGMEIGTGNSTIGTIARPTGYNRAFSINVNGVAYFHGSENNGSPTRNIYTSISVGSNRTVIDSYDSLGDGGGGMYRNLILMPTTDNGTDIVSGQVGGGFVGIGDFSSLTPANEPQTKFHVNGAVTIGTRAAVVDYPTNVGDYSLSVGTGHALSGDYGGILGGIGHTVSANHAWILGYSGTARTVATANTISLVTKTFVGTTFPYFTSLNTSWLYDNALSVRVEQASQNGIEVFANVNAADGALILATTYNSLSFPVSYDTQFVVNTSGQMGVGDNIFTTTDPLTATSSQWASVSPGISSRGSRNIVIEQNAPSPTAPTNSNSQHVVTSNRTSSASSTLRGKHLLVNPGKTRNVLSTTGAGQTSGSLTVGRDYVITTFVSGDDFSNVGAENVTGCRFTATGTTPTTWTNSSTLHQVYGKGGDLIIRGGKGEKNVSGSVTDDNYGDIKIGYDFETDAPTGSYVEVYGKVKMFESEPEGGSLQGFTGIYSCIRTGSSGQFDLPITGGGTSATGIGDYRAVDYDRMLLIDVVGNTITGLSSLAWTQILLNGYVGTGLWVLGRIVSTGSLWLPVPAGVQVYITVNPSTTDMNITIQELKMGKTA